ncbi:hypothetical protein AB0M39_04000 [Streptomyces sp. NPDC051907]|uniref:hypothetical protein n=1 Tax=Streptomyces sp. NPDC051907 TaxID=3155284 RepID=UPI00341541AC
MSGRKHKFEQYGPDGPFDDRTGNGIVNNRPDNELSGLAGLGDDEGLGGDELALRRLLQGAVQDLAPSDGALDHLRRAVPARRARKRQALVGVAAAVLLMGTAVPAFVHVASSSGSENARPVNAGHGEQTQGGTGQDAGDEGGDKGTADPTAGSQGKDPDDPDEKEKPGEKPGDGATEGPGGVVVPPGAATSSSPVCQASQLTSSAQAGAPDAEGKVYGSFRVTNASGTECAVSGAGVVGTAALGAADPGKISVVVHTTGDAASGLPDPSAESATLLLAPSASYEVKFAWVPSETCPTTPTPDPTPTDGGSSGTTTGTGTAAGDNTAPQLMRQDGGVQDGSVSVSHTAEGGGPGSSATVANACAGTVYRTGMLAAQ